MTDQAARPQPLTAEATALVAAMCCGMATCPLKELAAEKGFELDCESGYFDCRVKAVKAAIDAQAAKPLQLDRDALERGLLGAFDWDNPEDAKRVIRGQINAALTAATPPPGAVDGEARP